MNRIAAFILAIVLFNNPCYGEPENKIIVMISPPRTLSTAFMRMMQARGDFEIYHEITANPYNLIHYKEYTADWFREDAPKTYEEAKSRWLEGAVRKNVFIKEMSFYLHDFLMDDLKFIKKPNVQFVFLLRDPHSVILSFAMKDGMIGKDHSHLIGFQPIYELFEKIQLHAVHPPLILFSEKLSEHPREVVEAYCNFLKIPFIESALAWENLGENFTGVEEWHETKKLKYTKIWHGDAIRSTGFSPLRHYEVDENNRPTFSEIKNPELRNACFEAYELHLPYYQKFQAAFANQL